MKIIILILAVVMLSGCNLEPVYSDLDNVTDYLTYSEYTILLDALQGKSGITKSVIDSELNVLAPGGAYEYSYYQSGDYSCYNFNWSYWSSTSYDWIYYIDVDIWTLSGSLNRSMCSYYNGG